MPFVPAIRVSVCVYAAVPSIVAPDPEKLIAAPLPTFVVFKVMLFPKIVLPEIVMIPLFVVMLAARSFP